jgi:ABC-type multidrug transport system ATPase subunit
MSEAEELSDLLALIQRGRVVAEGTIAQLRDGLRAGVRCELRVRHMAPELPDALRRMAGILDVMAAREEASHLLRLTLSEEGAVLAALLREVVESGADIYSCATRQVTLEEIYLHTLSAPGTPEQAAVEVAPC